MNDINHAIALNNAGRFQEARVILESLDKKNKKDNWVKINLANCNIHLNDFEKAGMLLKAVLQTESKNDEYLLFASKLFLNISMFKHSIQAAKKAVNLNNKKLANVAQLVRASYEGRDISTAERGVDYFLKLEPNNQWALNFKALLCSGLGNFQQAQDIYRKMYEDDNSNIMALSGYVKAKKFSGGDPSLLELIEDSINKINSDPDTLARIYLSKAKVLNDAGQYQEAWEAAEKGKALKDSLFPFSKSSYENYIQQLFSAFQPESFKTVSKNQSEHLLIVGMPRSGTTLVEQILTQFPHYYPGGEVPAIDHALFRFFKGGDYLKQINNLTSKELTTIAGYYEDYFKQFANFSGKLIIDKVPSNYLHIGLFKKLFPKIKVINLVRSKFDVMASMMFTEFGQMLNYTNNIQNIDFVYEQYRRLMAYWEEQFASDIYSVGYDEFIVNNELQRQQLSEFLALPRIEDKYQESSNVVETPSVWQVRQGLYTDAIDRWKRYPQLVKYVNSL